MNCHPASHLPVALPGWGPKHSPSQYARPCFRPTDGGGRAGPLSWVSTPPTAARGDQHFFLSSEVSSGAWKQLDQANFIFNKP